MTNQSVITEERFSKGKTFTQYMESGIRNYDQFKENYENLALSPKQEAALGDLRNRPNGPDHMVIIGEDWCPDVYRGLPVGQKIGETLGIEVRIFERDDFVTNIFRQFQGVLNEQRKNVTFGNDDRSDGTLYIRVTFARLDKMSGGEDYDV